VIIILRSGNVHFFVAFFDMTERFVQRKKWNSGPVWYRHKWWWII